MIALLKIKEKLLRCKHQLFCTGGVLGDTPKHLGKPAIFGTFEKVAIELPTLAVSWPLLLGAENRP